jgi:hypothetical protein
MKGRNNAGYKLKLANALLAASALVLLVPAFASAAVLPVTNGVTLWLNTASLTGLTNGQAVGTWPDSSPNGYHPAQTYNLAWRPIFVTNGLAGRPVVNFAGAHMLTTPAIGALPNLSVFMVARSADMANRYALQFGDSSHAIIQGFGPSNWSWFNTPATVTLQPMSTTIYQTIWTTNGASVAGVWNIGSDGSMIVPFAGGIAEVLVYDRVLSAAESQSVIAYFDAQYFIPEPSTVALLAVGGGLVWWRRKRRAWSTGAVE